MIYFCKALLTAKQNQEQTLYLILDAPENEYELAQNEKQQQQKREQVERLTAEIAALEEQHETLQKTVRTLETEELTFQVKRLLNEGSLSPHDVMQLVNEAKPSKSKRKKAAAPAASDITGTEDTQ